MKKSGGLDNRLKMILVVAVVIFIVAVAVSMFFSSSPSYGPQWVERKVPGAYAESASRSGTTLSKAGSGFSDSDGSLRGGSGYVCELSRFTNNSNYTNGGGCFGDVDFNGVVTAGDRGYISANIGQIGYHEICRFDLDGNGVVNAADRGFVSANIGLCTPLPDYQNGDNCNHGVCPDPRFTSPPTNTTNVTHTVCQSNMCVSVQGAGSNLCSTNADCSPPTNTTNLTANFNVYRRVSGVWQIVNPTTSYIFAENELVRFDASPSAGSITTYSWSFGDGMLGLGLIVNHSYLNITNGSLVTYPVRLNVYGSGPTASVIKNVRVLGH